MTRQTMSLLPEVLDRLLELDEDPRCHLVQRLRQAIAAGDDVPTGEVHLVATLAPGGAVQVHDQHGRPVIGVKAVESYPDQAGNMVLRICL